MKENDKTSENNLVSEYNHISEDQVICSSCESTNLEIYSKNEHWFIVCLDCGRIELFD
jgi:translation initiation factor 2 beta subunit (eIF-2beta)/eIF-5